MLKQKMSLATVTKKLSPIVNRISIAVATTLNAFDKNTHRSRIHN